jgi:predicted transcriptional regulator
MLDAGLADADAGKSRKAEDVISDIERKFGLGNI